ncbi:hypothetical protein FNH05_23345 [Amycolatopsis rhizosphaerae]|uniref:YcaO domain-containing protein n=1 Tax=Amycolatopsis rhizosphaerae TaxID=2053003 RepID=A0A558BWF4_9PSEU|nr:YcaO-like family protein [Amycolatopsis rhizosphaerae]TVT40865.1 hypothetical protein FNH05_23345 [Amycolatopsis rhizosphaerae]
MTSDAVDAPFAGLIPVLVGNWLNHFMSVRTLGAIHCTMHRVEVGSHVRIGQKLRAQCRSGVFGEVVGSRCRGRLLRKAFRERRGSRMFRQERRALCRRRGGREARLTERSGRACPADETFARFRRLMPSAGVTRLADVTGLDVLGISVYLAVRPGARSLAVSVGKGMDTASARTAALMESLEVWRAENLDTPGQVASFRELTDNGITAVDPDTLPLALDAEPTGHRQRRATWIPGSDVSSGRRVWVPLDVVSLDFRLGSLTAPWLARNSNGLASGNTRPEALLHALCEVIERDAEWRWRTSDDERRIALDTVRDAECRRLLDRFAAHGVYVAAWDITSAVGLPVVGCVILSNPNLAEWFGTGVHDGFCCRPDPAVALAGALQEAAQKKLTYISGSRDDVTREEMARAHDTGLVQRVWDDLHVGGERTDFATVRSYTPHGAGSDVAVAAEALLRAGFERIVVVEVAGAHPGPWVVKAVVPGAYGPYGSALAPSGH